MAYKGKHEGEPSRTTKKLAIAFKIVLIIKNVLEAVAALVAIFEVCD